MKKALPIIVILLFLAACGGGAAELPVEEAQGPAATPLTEKTDASPGETSTAATPKPAAEAAFPATNVASASVIRDRDWVKGAADPVITIVEYGDFQ